MDAKSITSRALELALDRLIDRTDPDIDLFCDYWNKKWCWKMEDWMNPPGEDPSDMLFKHDDLWRHEVDKWLSCQTWSKMGCYLRAHNDLLDALEEERDRERLEKEVAEMVNAEGAMKQ